MPVFWEGSIKGGGGWVVFRISQSLIPTQTRAIIYSYTTIIDSNTDQDHIFLYDNHWFQYRPGPYIYSYTTITDSNTGQDNLVLSQSTNSNTFNTITKQIQYLTYREERAKKSVSVRVYSVNTKQTPSVHRKLCWQFYWRSTCSKPFRNTIFSHYFEWKTSTCLHIPSSW